MTISEIRAIYKKIYDIGRSYERSYHFSDKIAQYRNSTIIHSVDETIEVDGHYNDQFTIDIDYYESSSGDSDDENNKNVKFSITCADSGITLDYDFFEWDDEHSGWARCKDADISEFKKALNRVWPEIAWFDSSTVKVIEEIQQYVNSINI